MLEALPQESSVHQKHGFFFFFVVFVIVVVASVFVRSESKMS